MLQMTRFAVRFFVSIQHSNNQFLRKLEQKAEHSLHPRTMVPASQLKCDHLKQVPSYDEFLEQYLIPNIPVTIGSALIKHWSAVKRWRKDTEKQKSPTISGESSSDIDWGYLSEHYGAFQVSVADCSRVDDLGNQERDETQLSGVVSTWVSGEGQPLYVKDWHLARQVEQKPSGTFYSTPDIFRDDWMNAYYTAYTDDDFRFVYVGAKGTFTPLHRDVYSSYSWSTNICGRKRWWLFPPAQTPYLHRKYGRRIPYDVREATDEDYPDLHRTSSMIVDQNEGETIFVLAERAFLVSYIALMSLSDPAAGTIR